MSAVPIDATTGSSPSCRSDGLDARLAEGEDVGVPLDDDGSFLFRDGSARTIEAIEEVTLAKELSFRRVHVLRAQRIVFAQLAGLEAEHTSTRIGEWKEKPPREVVVAAAVREAGREQLVPRKATPEGLARKGRPPERKPEPVFATDVLAQSTAREIVPRRRPRLRVPEVALVERGGRVEQLEQPLAPAALRVLLRT